MRGKKRFFASICDQPYGHSTPYQLFDAAKNSKEFVQKLQLQIKLQAHDGCVNSICWNDTGKYILSGSDDQRLSVVNVQNYSTVANVETGHRANIFSAKYLPNTGDNEIASCSGDGVIVYSRLDRPESSLFNKFNCHRGTAYEIMTVANDPHSFLSCGEDRTVRWFDLRAKTSCLKEHCKEDILINCLSPVTSLAVNPLLPYQLAVGCADATVRIFDRRMLSTQPSGSSSSGLRALMTRFTVPEFTQNRRITSLCYSPDGNEMLVSYSSDYIYLFDVRDNLNKDPTQLKKNGGGSEPHSPSRDECVSVRGRDLMKRLRVRGDWSDTGPNARSEAELSAETNNERPYVQRPSIMRAMTDILTRIFQPAASHPEENEQEAANSSESEMDLQTSPHPESNTDMPNVDNNSLCDTNVPSTSGALSQEEVLKESNEETRPDGHRDIPTISSSQNNFNDSGASEDRGIIESGGVTDGDENTNIDEDIKKLETKSNDLMEKHNTVPMVNLHYSGKGLTSGQITVDIASSSSANERQWVEQNVPESPTTPDTEVQSESPLSETLQTVDPRDPLPDLEPGPGLVVGVGEESDVEMLVEADIWQQDSDDDVTESPFRNDEKDASLEEERFSSFASQPRIKKKYSGHRNARTMIKESTFWGDRFVVSGSDCGHIFFWDRESAEVVMLMEADHHVVNCLQPHPFDPVLASSGIDYDIKIWEPTRDEPLFDEEKANEIIRRNEVMLEETKDTITVPASFMFRMLTSFTTVSGPARRWRRVARELRRPASGSGQQDSA